jgi:secreted trypsin-like serine protease
VNPTDQNQRGEEPHKFPTFLDKLEQISKISVPVMIPILVAIIGYFGSDLLNARQTVIEQKKIDLEYVKIAQGILSNLKPQTDTRIVNWAYQTLFQLSPVKVSQEDIADLSQRRAPLPSSAPTSSISGGIAVTGSDWPWLVVLSTKQFNGEFCHGTALSPTIVLTAAHCTTQMNLNPEDIKGMEVLRPSSAQPLELAPRTSVAKIIVHPGFSAETDQNDIAILVLDAQLSPPFVTISSQRSTDPPPGTLALVAAFDLFVQGQDKPLLQAAVPIVESEECLHFKERYFADTEICASESKGASCQGAGGGPLMALDRNGQKYQIGIVSSGDICGRPGAHGVYTRVSSYSDWIRQSVPVFNNEAAKDTR